MFRRGHIVALPLMGAAFWYTIQFMRGLLFAVTHLSIAIDPTIARPLAQSIDAYTRKHFSIHDPLGSVVIIRRNFPIIERITSRKNFDGSLGIVIDSAWVKALVNNNFVVNADGNVLKANLIDEAVLLQLPRISAPSSVLITKEFAIFTKNLNADVLVQHAIDWHNMHEIYLTSLNSADFKILVSYDNLVLPCLIQACKRLYLQFCSSEKIRSSSKRIFIADLRFQGQIVTYLEGGNRDGKGIF